MAFKFLKMRHLMVAVSIVALVILGSASFHRTVSAKANTETYKGLKVFSDVIEEIEANYVDEVKTDDLIQ